MGVTFAGLVLALSLPLLVDAGQSSALPKFVTCEVQPRGGLCESVRVGTPGGEVVYDGRAVYELHGEMRSGRTTVTSPYKVGYGSEAPPKYPFLVCAQPSGGQPSGNALECLTVSNANRSLIESRPGTLGLYVIVQPQP